MQRLEKKKEKVVRSLGQLIGYGCHHEDLRKGTMCQVQWLNKEDGDYGIPVLGVGCFSLYYRS